jgi:hypothetical protein
MRELMESCWMVRLDEELLMEEGEGGRGHGVLAGWTIKENHELSPTFKQYRRTDNRRLDRVVKFV